jgi:hypothetical protein
MTRLTAAFALSAIFACGPVSGDEKTNHKKTNDSKTALPKLEADAIAHSEKFKSRWEENKKITNAFAKKEAMEELRKDVAEFQSQFKKTLAEQGVNDWVGQAFVFEDRVTIGDRLQSRVTFNVSTRGLANDVKETVKRINNGDRVTFSIAIDNKAKIEVSSTGGGIAITVDGTALTKVTVSQDKR